MSFIAKFKNLEKLSPRLKNLYLHRIIRMVGINLFMMFGPIFFYVLSGKFDFVLILYGLVSLIMFFLLPFWAKILKYFSMHIFMIIASFLTALYFIFGYFLSQKEEVVIPIIAAMILTTALERIFYWTPYHVDLARFMNKHHRGRQFSFLFLFITILSIIIPIFAGFIIGKFGFPVLYIIAIVIIILSVLPLFFIPHSRENYSFGYRESFKKLFFSRHIKSNMAYMADGFQSGIGFIIWPIFIFILLDGRYMEVGVISSAVVLLTVILQFFTGEFTDKLNKKKMLHMGSILYALGWVFKATVASAWHIFIAGSYHNFVKILMRTPFDVLMYEIVADEGHYRDEFTVIREMSIHFGRVIMIGMAIIVTYFTSVIWVFIIGAFVSLLMNFVSKEDFIDIVRK